MAKKTTSFGQITQDSLVTPNALIPVSAFVSGNVTTGVKLKFVSPVAGTVHAVRAHAGTAPVGAAILVDVHKNGTTMFTTQGSRITIADGANVSSTTLPDVTAVAAGDYLEIEVDQIGSGTPGANLAVTVLIETALVT